MSTMPIEYVEPYARAWKRMKNLLFRPFDLGRWIAIGFTAWLATLTEGGGGGGGNFPINDKRELDHLGLFIREHLTVIIVVASVVLLFCILLGFLLSWLSARGKFMFLDNALTGQAEIVAPWRAWRKQGNSLFWWEFAFGWILLAVILVLALPCVATAWPDIHSHLFRGYSVAAIILGFFLLLPFLLVVGYITVFLHDFVVPLMRKHDLKTNAAWRLFRPLLRANFGAFLLYGLLRFAISMLLGIVLATVGCFACVFTCGCVGCLLAMPFVGTVILLPVMAWERYWGPEFLRQYGPEFDAWISAPAALPEAPVPVTAAPETP